MRVVVSGGGTGGHIFPALAVAESLRRLRPDCELLFIGGSSGMETQIVPERGVPFQAVTARKLRRVLSPSTLGVMFALVKGYGEAKTYLRAFKADAVVGTGGYVAAATTLAGARLGLPTFIVEGNVLAGRTNRWLARFVSKIGVAFETTQRQFPAPKTVLTGLPLRAGIVAPPEVTPQQARSRFVGLSPDRFTVVVIGGSQGAKALNLGVLEAADRLLAADIQIVHQTGPKNLEEVKATAEKSGLLARAGYLPLPFLNETQVTDALRAADMVVCRGGISTLSEVLANGLPCLVVPLPTAYADHQTVNAQALVAGGAAVLLSQNELTGEKLAKELLHLREDAARRKAMSAASCGLGRPDAADAVAREVISLIEQQ